MTSAPALTMARVIAGATAATMLIAGASAIAQTPAPTASQRKSQSQSRPAWSVPAAKAAPLTPAARCSRYGEGFIAVPGTDTCVKAGGYLRTEGSITRGR